MVYCRWPAAWLATLCLWMGHHLPRGLRAQAPGFNSSFASERCVTFGRSLTVSVPLVCKVGRAVGLCGTE